MRTLTSKLGTVVVGPVDRLYERAISLVEDVWQGGGRPLGLGMSGGGTPRAWYDWGVRVGAWVPDLVRDVVWGVSDERVVPLSDLESNFGQLERRLLQPLGVVPERRVPWPVGLAPVEAADRFGASWWKAAGGAAFDVCFLGLGEDGHTASLFPGSPLLEREGEELFAAVEVPGHGWRLTVTPSGLAACGRLVVLAVGAAKAAPFRRALYEADDPLRLPIQLLARWRERVWWLMDDEAAAPLMEV